MLLFAASLQAAEAAVATRDWFDVLVGVAGALNTLILLAILLVVAPVLFEFVKIMRQLRALLDRLYDDLKPFTGHANRIAANVDEITDSVRTEVKHVTESIAQANEGISRAIASTEKRLSQFGELVDVAQEKAGRALGVNGDDDTDDRPSRPRVRAKRKRRD